MEWRTYSIILVFLLSYFTTSVAQDLQQELPIVVLICSYNNAPWVNKNLDSVREQQYENYRILYMDDCSSDDTCKLVQQYAAKYGMEDKIMLITNQQRYRKMKQLYNAMQLCQDNEIVIQLDGDDRFIDPQYFATINKLYQEEDVWLTYGNYGYPNGDPGILTRPIPQSVIDNHGYRKFGFVYMHPRSFWGWLFKLIKLQDVMVATVPGYEGRFIPASNDHATMMPMVEMAHKRLRFLKKITYEYNTNNPISGFAIEKPLQRAGRIEVKSMPSYPVVEKPITQRLELLKDAYADLIVLSLDNPEGVQRLIDSIYTYATGLANMTILYEATHSNVADDYKQLQKRYRGVLFKQVREKAVKSCLYSLLNTSQEQHVLVARDTIFLTKNLNVHECICQLAKTFAHGFYIGFDHEHYPFVDDTKKELIPHEHIWEDVCAWKFECGKHAHFNNFDLTLFTFQQFKKHIQPLPDTCSIGQFLNALKVNQHISLHNVGLFFASNNVDGDRTHNTYSLTLPKRKKRRLKKYL